MLVIDNFDIYKEVGHDYATLQIFQVTIEDEQININFTAIKNAAKISAIEVVSLSDDPILSVNPTVLNFGSNLTILTLSVKNSGGDTLNWQAAENPDQAWITSVDPQNGSLSYGQSQTVTVTVNRTGLETVQIH